MLIDPLPMSEAQHPYRLRLPGPVAVPERVRRAVSAPMLNHRGPEFRAILSRVEELIKPVLGTDNPVIFFASSGTGAMEASLVNVLAPTERVLVCVNGQFGQRFADIAKALGVRVDALDFEWGSAVEPAAIAQRLQKEDYRAVVVVGNESSTGVVADLAAIGKIVRDSPALLIVDSVSGLGGIEMRQDDWNLDIVVSASQKALMCPPGVAIASASQKAMAVIRRESGMPRFYWDFRRAFASIEKNETPFTSPVSLMAGLREALEMMHEEGLANVLARHRRLSSVLRAGCSALGLVPFGQADALSNTVVALEVPNGLNGTDIVRHLYDRYRTVIAGSRNKLSGRVIRIGIMGDCNEGDVLMDLKYIQETLQQLGWTVTTGVDISGADVSERHRKNV